VAPSGARKRHPAPQIHDKHPNQPTAAGPLRTGEVRNPPAWPRPRRMGPSNSPTGSKGRCCVMRSRGMAKPGSSS